MKKPIYTPHLYIEYIDGRYVCRHLHSGCEGFGDHPKAAIDDFERAWNGDGTLRKDIPCLIHEIRYVGSTGIPKYYCTCTTHNSAKCNDVVKRQKQRDEEFEKASEERRVSEEKRRISIYGEPEKVKKRLWWWR